MPTSGSSTLRRAAFRWDIVRLQFAGAMYWTAASLGILALARRYRLYGRRAVPHLVIHFAAAVTISFGFLWFLQAIGLSSGPDPRRATTSTR